MEHDAKPLRFIVKRDLARLHQHLQHHGKAVGAAGDFKIVCCLSSTNRPK